MTFHAFRRLSHSSRAALLALLLVFGLNGLAHVAHGHDAAPASSTDSALCGYCVSFGGLADAPHAARIIAAATPDEFCAFRASVPLRSFEHPASALPRAPPHA